MFIESDLAEGAEELFDFEVLHGIASAFFEGFDEILQACDLLVSAEELDQPRFDLLGGRGALKGVGALGFVDGVEVRERGGISASAGREGAIAAGCGGDLRDACADLWAAHGLSTQGRFESAAWVGVEDAVEDMVDGLCAIGEIAKGVGEDVLFIALQDAGRFGAFEDLFENDATLEDGLEGLIFFGVVGGRRDGFEITGRGIRRGGLW